MNGYEKLVEARRTEAREEEADYKETEEAEMSRAVMLSTRPEWCEGITTMEEMERRCAV